MHKIRFRPGLRPRPRWGSSQHSPKPSSWILGGPIYRRKKKKGKEGGKQRKGGTGKREVKEREKRKGEKEGKGKKR